MLKSGRLLSSIQPSVLQGLYGTYQPNSSLVLSNDDKNNNNNTKRNSSTTSAASAAGGKLPDPSKAIFSSNMYHYSSIGLVTLLPISLMLPTSEITMVTDSFLALAIPAHYYLGMNSVVNDYIYSKFPKLLSKAFVLISSAVIFGGFIVIAKGAGFGYSVRQLWVSK
ncbi:succinate dehydrogenase [Cavenderia fasciculata]|uniref:Succinate dehydrogenase [ubiquinone] cytochrome b small subunit n=1 Tax=Cavenderia fasciculata TaxID=261658 RepID=F4PJL6_CACFS|nr:succinate dehydrogenase [Cavenderia fasciculata]EGG23790.1 succinate dehydrogenase [Cavenderia fasciculata]|eukprot:XP_004361641.1 succinate dehydrogenase [Cavenderia fasciculata]